MDDSDVADVAQDDHGEDDRVETPDGSELAQDSDLDNDLLDVHDSAPPTQQSNAQVASRPGGQANGATLGDDESTDDEL